MKVLYVHNAYAAHTGEEQAANAIVQLLRENGHLVEWYSRISREIAATPGGSIKAFFTGMYNPCTVGVVTRQLEAFKPDVVQVQNIFPLISPSVFRAVRAYGVPVVMRCPNYRLFCPNGLFFDLDGKVCEKCTGRGKEFWMLYKNCMGSRFKSLGYALRGAVARISRMIQDSVDVFIVQTEFQKQKFMEHGIAERRICIVPGLAPDVTAPSDSGPGRLVSFVGRVSHEKGIREFLAAAGRLPDIPFAIAGNVSLPGVQDEAPPNVKWMGFLEGKDLDEFFLNSRMIVAPSRWYEGFPNVITRAMRFSRPVIAADIGAMSSIVDDGVTGLKFRPGNEDDLASKIAALYGNIPLCEAMGRAGHETAAAFYSQSTVYALLMAAYDRAGRNFRQCFALP